MEVFQFYFNRPRRAIFLRSKKEPYFDSFCYKPSEIKEENLGILCILGKTENSRKGIEKLKETAEKIKESYYKSSDGKIKEEDCFKKCFPAFTHSSCLKEISELLILAITRKRQCFFTQKGDFKVILYRGREIFDISGAEGICGEEKVFSDIFKGQLNENDRLLIVNANLFNSLWEYKFFKKFKQARTARALKKIFQEKKRTISELSGILVFISLKRKKFNFLKKFPSPKIKLIRQFKIKNKIKLKRPRLSGKALNILPSSPFLREKMKKGFISLIILLIILALGYLFL